jgi:peroxiredoxin
MKKILVKVFVVLIFFFALILLYKTIAIIKANEQIAIAKQSLPKFHFYTQDLKQLNYEQVSSTMPTCIFYYNAECEYCQDEAKHLQQKISAFDNIQIFMVSVNTPKVTKRFAEEYKLNKYKNIVWLYDKDFNFHKWFGNAVTPSVFIYNNKHNLIKEYRGEVKMELVLKNIFDDKKG